MITHHNHSNICLVTNGVIVHGCNAQGVMGSGVAKQLRARYPEIFHDYVATLEVIEAASTNPLGEIVATKVSKDLIIVNAITQEYYGRAGKKYVDYAALESCLSRVAYKYSNSSIHIPYLIGAGLGGGDEKTILCIIETKLKDCDVHLHHWK